MKCVQLLLVFAFFIFPSFINAAKIKCQMGDHCHLSLKTTIMNVYDKSAPDCTDGCVRSDDDYCERADCECEDACVYFKCVITGKRVIEGAGCYDKFDNLCPFTKTETKNQVIKNITRTKSGSEYYDNTTMIVTCRSDFCARDAFKKFAEKDNGKAQKAFGSALSDVTYDLIDRKECGYGPLPKRFAGKVVCSKREWCETGKNFDIMYLGEGVQSQGVKECDACVFYRCTNGGRNIMSGFGCYEDFEKICQNVPSDVKESIKSNIKDSFHFDGGNYVVATCSDSNIFNCAQRKFKFYSDANPSSRIKVDKTADGVCEVGVVGSASFSSPHQINIWLLLGLFFAGILYRMA